MPLFRPQNAFERGGRVHVGNRDDSIDAKRFQRGPAALNVADVRHISHGAAGFQVRQDHGLFSTGEDICRLRHEVDSAEQDDLGIAAGRGLLAQFVAIAAEIRELDHFVALIVMAQHHHPVADLPPQLPDPRDPFIRIHLEVGAIDLVWRSGSAPYLRRVGYAPTVSSGTQLAGFNCGSMNRDQGLPEGERAGSGRLGLSFKEGQRRDHQKLLFAEKPRSSRTSTSPWWRSGHNRPNIKALLC